MKLPFLILKKHILMAGVLAIMLCVTHGWADVTLTTLVTFDYTNGYMPNVLVVGRDGNFYGNLSYGGWNDLGTVFRMAPDGTCVILVTFDGDNGRHPSDLIQGKDGNFYGTTLQGGPSGNGSIFKMSPDGTITTLATFGDDNGYGPWGLVQGRDGNLYGKMSQFRGQSSFEVTLGGKLIIPATNDLPAESVGLLKAINGNTYGTTFSGRGDNANGFGHGTVFKISPAGARTNLIAFNGTNGANPLPVLVQDRDGNIYGITTSGGAFKQGTIFRVNSAKTSRPEPNKINIPTLLHPPAKKINLLVSALGNNGAVTTETNAILDSKNANPYLDKFIFLPGGFRRMAATISATNETFRLALRYIGEANGGHRPPKLPKGVTIADVSNVSYMLSVWSMTTPPRPINFYGKVVDENDQPVAGATAHFIWDGGVTNNNPRPFTDTGKKTIDVTTDSAGLFSLTNAMGTELDVSAGKTGYYVSRRNRGQEHFKYSKMNLDSFYGIGDYFKPDSNNPVIYHLRKMGIGADSLVTSQFGMRENFWVTVPRDGTPVEVDLLQQKIGNGSLEIKQTKPTYPAHGGIVQNLSPADQAKLVSATNWSFTMKFSDGGLIEENEEFPFSPPESGYQSVVEYNFNKVQTNWTTELKKDFYIKFGNPPLYGQLQVETSSHQQTVILTYVINPDGSRNLEPKQNYFPSSSVWRH